MFYLPGYGGEGDRERSEQWWGFLLPQVCYG